MRRFLGRTAAVVAVLVAALLAGGVASAQTDKRVALVIGNAA